MAAPRSQGLIVVGVDGSPASAWALQWAASEATLRRAGLIITHVEPMDGDEGSFAHFTRLERLLAHSARAVALSPHPVPLSTHLVRGDMQDIGDELIRMKHNAAILVLRRARLRPPAAHETLGTIESRLAIDAGCPTVLVAAPSPVRTTSGPGVVVSCSAGSGALTARSTLQLPKLCCTVYRSRSLIPRGNPSPPGRRVGRPHSRR